MVKYRIEGPVRTVIEVEGLEALEEELDAALEEMEEVFDVGKWEFEHRATDIICWFVSDEERIPRLNVKPLAWELAEQLIEMKQFFTRKERQNEW